MSTPEVVHEFPLRLGGWGVAPTVNHKLQMPAGAVVLALQLQHDVPTLWAQVNPKNPAVTRIFEWVGTGCGVPPGGEYVGTVQMQGGAYVFHLYEVPNGDGAA